MDRIRVIDKSFSSAFLESNESEPELVNESKTQNNEETLLLLENRNDGNDLYKSTFAESDGRCRTNIPRSPTEPRVASWQSSWGFSLTEKHSPDRNASAFLAGWNVTNMIQGMGILGVPYAVKEGGVAAAISIILVAFLCDITGIILVDCLYVTSSRTGARKRVRCNYAEVGEAVWNTGGGKIVTIVQTVELFSAAVLYLLLLTTMFAEITSKILPEISLNSWAVMCGVAVLPSVFIKRMSLLAWMSMLAVISLMAALFVIIIYCITEHARWEWSNIPEWNSSTFPIGFGIITFSYCAHAVFPSVEASMKQPKQFNCMMHTSFSVSALIKVVFAFMCVLTFGAETDQVVTVNMRNSVYFSTMATILVALNVFFSFPLPLFVVIESFDSILLPHFSLFSKEGSHHWLWILITRILLVDLALFLAIMVPHFALLMGFVGSFSGTCLSFAFPCLAHLKLKWKFLRWYHITGEIMLIVFGLITGGFGLVYSGKALIKSFTAF